MIPVVFTQAAYAGLRDIAMAIRRDNPARAETFVAELHDRCLRLEHLPMAYPLVPGWEQHGIRRRPFGAYLIFYRIHFEQVEILHILHGARDYEEILGDAGL